MAGGDASQVPASLDPNFLMRRLETIEQTLREQAAATRGIVAMSLRASSTNTDVPGVVAGQTYTISQTLTVPNGARTCIVSWIATGGGDEAFGGVNAWGFNVSAKLSIDGTPYGTPVVSYANVKYNVVNPAYAMSPRNEVVDVTGATEITVSALLTVSYVVASGVLGAPIVYSGSQSINGLAMFQRS